MKDRYNLIKKGVVLLGLLALIPACATNPDQARKEESWVSSKVLKFDDIVYFAANNELGVKRIQKDEVLKEFLFTYTPMAKEYEARLITQYDIAGYLKGIQQKIEDYNKTAGYKDKTYRLFTNMTVGQYSPKQEAFLMFTPYDNYSILTINNPMPRSHEIASAQNSGKGSFSASLRFQPYFKLPISKESATKALTNNFAIKQNMSVPVMLEYTVDHCSIITGSNESNGASYCIIKIKKASVFEKSDIDGYTQPINYLVPVDEKAASSAAK